MFPHRTNANVARLVEFRSRRLRSAQALPALAIAINVSICGMMFAKNSCGTYFDAGTDAFQASDVKSLRRSATMP